MCQHCIAEQVHEGSCRQPLVMIVLTGEPGQLQTAPSDDSVEQVHEGSCRQPLLMIVLNRCMRAVADSP